MRWLKRIVLWGLAASIVGALVWAFLPKPVAVELETAVRGPFEVTVSESGRTRVRQRFAVAAPAAGTVSRITLRPGDRIERGQLLARVRPIEPPLLDARTHAQALSRVQAASAARRQAAEQVERAQALLAFARDDAVRQRALAQAGTAPERNVEAAELEERMRKKDVAAAEWSLQVATSELESARVLLARSGIHPDRREEVEVRAPAAGVVLRLAQESEAPVAVGTPLLEIGDPGDLEILVDLLTPDAVRVAPGAQARIEGWGRSTPLAARVRRVEPAGFTRVSALGVEEQRVTVILDMLEGAPALGDAFRVEVTITLFAAPEVLQVPASAVFRVGADWAVFVANQGRVGLRPIRIGERNPSAVEVTGGLQAGERVLLHPSDRVRQGVRYLERSEAAPGA